MLRVLLLLVLFLVVPKMASAQEGAAETNYTPPLERRSGFTLGLDYGVGMGSYVGYPNEVEKIDNPDYRSSTGVAPASGYSIWLGGALRDWFTIAVGLFGVGGRSDDVTAGAGGIGLHLETFPLFSLGAAWRDLGLITEFGAGGGTLTDDAGDETGNGGSMAIVGLGVFFEPWQFWQVSHGPVLMFNSQFSDTMTATSVLAGWRIALYWTQKDD